MLPKNRVVLGFVGIVSFGVVGCGQSLPAAAPVKQATDTTSRHGGWWCDEHGVPEEVCALCDRKLAAEFKAKGDWCKEHDRPESQCFACNPELEAQFAAQYAAKYGKQPPQPWDDEGHDHHAEHEGHDHDEPHS